MAAPSASEASRALLAGPRAQRPGKFLDFKLATMKSAMRNLFHDCKVSNLINRFLTLLREFFPKRSSN